MSFIVEYYRLNLCWLWCSTFL